MKRELPWTLESTPTSAFIGLTVLVSLPSIRLPDFKILDLTNSFSTFFVADEIKFSVISSLSSEINSSVIFNLSIKVAPMKTPEVLGDVHKEN